MQTDSYTPFRAGSVPDRWAFRGLTDLNLGMTEITD
jgi:hypothetical protein